MTRLAHAIDFSSPSIKGDGAAMAQSEIVRFVRGVRGPRKSPVTAAQIKNWFRATPSEFIDSRIDATLLAGRIKICPRSLGSSRRASGSYVYEAI